MNAAQEELLDRLLTIYQGVSERVLEFRKASNSIELAILAMSILTAGSLWVLISDHFVDPSKWVGAIVATLLAFLASYQKAFGPSRLLEDARTLHRDIGAEIAALRASTSTQDLSRYWDALKEFEARSLDLGGPPKPPKGLTKEQEEQWRQQRWPQ